MNVVKLDLTDLSVPQLIAELQALLNAITGNAAFSTLTAKITALNTALTALISANTAYDAALQAADQKLTLRGDARVIAETAARTLASGAEAVTTDPATLEGGGFHMRATAAPVGAMPQPQNLHASGGDLEGTADVQWNAIKRGVQSYIGEYATASGGPWTQFYVGAASKAVGTGLTSGTQYWFRVRAVGAAGPGPWSDPATIRAT